ncbi:MAG TPA: nucleotide exchange factor GrpE [Candidatus Anaerotignum merdipullorum]|nr:nucleotide exchange factor GrpE [Candidatus Anaerotignum merdipullorum]
MEEKNLNEANLNEENLQEAEEQLEIQTQTELSEATETEEVDEAAAKIAELEQKAAEHLDQYQRCLAEFDNFRKRTAKEKASMYDDGVRDTVEKLLSVVDNLERAVAAQEGKDAEDAFFKGVQMTLKQFQEILHSMGVEEIKAMGEKFDPNLHAAVAHEDDEAYGENEIVLEMLKGYKYKDKVIRHSMVKVAN